MDLLSSQDHAEIRSAIHDVTDTFCKTSIVLNHKVGSLDRFQEENDTNGTYVDYNLKALVEEKEYGRDWDKITTIGAINNAEVKLTLNFDDVDNLGLVDHTNDYKLLISAQKDKLILRGTKYDILFAGTDGPIEDKPLLVIIYCNQQVQTL